MLIVSCRSWTTTFISLVSELLFVSASHTYRDTEIPFSHILRQLWRSVEIVRERERERERERKKKTLRENSVGHLALCSDRHHVK